VTGQLGDPGGVLIAEETGFIKKDGRSAGVQRQYAGTAGRTENCQAGVFLAYASVHGHALVDRELYLPKSWTDDRDRRRGAGIPEKAEFASKPRLAQAMVSRALEAGVPFAWFAADEAYGQAKWLQASSLALVHTDHSHFLWVASLDLGVDAIDGPFDCRAVEVFFFGVAEFPDHGGEHRDAVAPLGFLVFVVFARGAVKPHDQALGLRRALDQRGQGGGATRVDEQHAVGADVFDITCLQKGAGGVGTAEAETVIAKVPVSGDDSDTAGLLKLSFHRGARFHVYWSVY